MLLEHRLVNVALILWVPVKLYCTTFLNILGLMLLVLHYLEIPVLIGIIISTTCPEQSVVGSVI